jgi:hypothetical protein
MTVLDFGGGDALGAPGALGREALREKSGIARDDFLLM